MIGVTQSASRSKYLQLNEEHPLYAYLYILPFLLFFSTFVLYPLWRGLYTSFTQYDIMHPPEFVGLKNYRRLIVEDGLFVTCLRNTLFFMLMNVPLAITIPLILAELLNAPIFGRGFFRSSFAFPIMIAVSATGIIWGWLLHPVFGILNRYLRLVGLPGQMWLSESDHAMPAIVLVSLWWGLGWNTILYLAGRQEIPVYLYEAARLDGANTWQLFRYITIPGLMTTTLYVTVMTIIASSQVFGQIYVMTAGGPGDATRTISMFIYNNGFLYFKMGYASAAAWLLFLVISVFVVIQFRMLRSRIIF